MSLAPTPELRIDTSSSLTFGILSTYPPTACGLATFSAALGRGLASNGVDVRIVRVADGSSTTSDNVVGEMVSGFPASRASSAALLNDCDVAVIQHEYGLYGGQDGDEVLDVLRNLEVPSIVVAHTVLTSPTPHQRSVLVEAAALADQVVVMSHAARERLCRVFAVDPAKVVTIPHGAAVPPRRPRLRPWNRPMLLTWGLVGPGKGIERVIDAMPALADLPSEPHYVIAGATHPKVLAHAGEAYRASLQERVLRNGVGGSVSFDPTYRDVPTLTSLIQSASVAVLPYDSADQVTSGVLVDAIAAGTPVVATAFPHAMELLATGAGIVVPHDDPDALAATLHRVVTDAPLTARMAREAARLAPTMAWPVVAGAYRDLADRLLAGRWVAA